MTLIPNKQNNQRLPNEVRLMDEALHRVQQQTSAVEICIINNILYYLNLDIVNH